MILTAFAAASLPWLGSANACEFHGGGFGPYGPSWQSFYGDELHSTYDADGLTDWAESQIENDGRVPERQLFERRPISRPSFSNAATRAAKTAKERVDDTGGNQSAKTAVVNQTPDKTGSYANR